MLEKWYFVRDKVRVGPVTRDQLLELVGTGELQPAHKIMREGTGRWLPAGDTPGLFAGQPAAPSVPPARSATPMPSRPQPAPASPAALARPGATPLPGNPAAGPAKLPPAALSPAAPAPAKPAALARPAALSPTAAPPPKPPVAPAKPAAPTSAAAPPGPARPPAAPPTPMIAGWFYVQDKKKLGPVSTAELKKLAQTGGLRVGDMVMRAGQNKWRVAGEVPGLFPSPMDETLEEDEDEIEDEEDEDEEDEDEVEDEEDEDEADEDEEIDVDEHLDRAAECKAKGNYAGAIAEYDTLVTMLPDEPEGYNGLAWVWATCPDAKIRNGAKAVEYARMAVELASNAESAADDEEEADECVALRVECQETLAVAQAEAGNFAAAIATLDSALADADPNDQPRLKQRRQQFQAKQPVREGAKSPSDSKR